MKQIGAKDLLFLIFSAGIPEVQDKHQHRRVLVFGDPVKKHWNLEFLPVPAQSTGIPGDGAVTVSTQKEQISQVRTSPCSPGCNSWTS